MSRKVKGHFRERKSGSEMKEKMRRERKKKTGAKGIGQMTPRIDHINQSYSSNQNQNQN